MFLRLGLDAAPLMLRVHSGTDARGNFRRAMLLSRGSFAIFFTRPISGTLLALIGLFMLWQLAVFFLRMRERRRAASPGPLAEM